jgi:hypothetical protein
MLNNLASFVKVASACAFRITTNTEINIHAEVTVNYYFRFRFREQSNVFLPLGIFKQVGRTIGDKPGSKILQPAESCLVPSHKSVTNKGIL